ncbi:methyltransferase [Myxococcus phage Mx8]|uniref:DNA adenine methylase Mox n=1 Tax=Myxococcus phage Mx8 TaxID=49964 RepID=O03956_9CAUD|nr:methyltransferase [Myxococcus phage Mx8]AAC48900.1 DNA adenine methyltransferase [Myxococcus phage Mx8]AAK94340.1 DNA adenine methylase Mox [Myxococcus phage Mx8]
MACRPYYQRGDVTLYHCTHEELADALQAESVDAIVTDPPYGETALEWDRWPVGWPGLVRPLLKRTGSMWCFGSFRMWWDKRDEFVSGGWVVAEDVVWRKQNGSGFATDRFRRVHEQPVHFYRADAAWRDVFHQVPVTMDAKARTVTRRAQPPHLGAIGAHKYTSEDGGPRLMTSVLEVRNCHGFAVNETQKPVALVEPLVRNACPPGGLVADFFAGSGSTALACLATGRRFIGCDIREAQCEAAARELSQVLPLGFGA